jgi:hypothetical protein
VLKSVENMRITQPDYTPDPNLLELAAIRGVMPNGMMISE